MKRSAHRLAGRAGLTLIEVLVVAGLLGVVMSLAYGSVIAQMRRHAGQMLLSEAMHSGRSAFNVLTDQIELAGFGVPTASTPSKAPMLVTTDPTKLSFWVSTRAVHSYLTAAAALGATTVKLLSTSGLKVGGTVYIADATRWYSGTISAVRNDAIDVKPALTYNFPAGSSLTPVELVTFDYADGALRRNGKVLIPNVTSLAFTYDAKTPAAVRIVTVALSVQTRAAEARVGRRTVSLATRVAPPQLAL
ncbi:MAG: type II secretion system protein [Deltaproteobacteria bacterium]|nr:type II secretion system protein [Deltaproteobacteria bacterium]